MSLLKTNFLHTWSLRERALMLMHTFWLQEVVFAVSVTSHYWNLKEDQRWFDESNEICEKGKKMEWEKMEAGGWCAGAGIKELAMCQ